MPSNIADHCETLRDAGMAALHISERLDDDREGGTAGEQAVARLISTVLYMVAADIERQWTAVPKEVRMAFGKEATNG